MKKIIIVLVGLYGGVVWGQEYKKDLIKIIPNTPDVAFFEKYNESILNGNNGSISNDYEIFRIKEGDIEMPIKLIYSYNGNNSTELPTRLGYGWNLQDSGMIITEIRGKSDFSRNGFVLDSIGSRYIKPLLQDQYSSQKENALKILELSRNGYIDSETDKYNILLPNQSVEFYFTPEREIVITPNEKFSKINFNYVLNNPNFKVIDNSGITYEFSAKDEVIERNCSSYIEVNSAINSYYLTKIKDTKNNEINYEYELLETLATHTQPKILSDLQISCLIDELHDTNCLKFKRNFLKKINTKSTVVEYSYIHKNAFTILLDKILVKNNKGELISNYIFEYYDNFQLKNLKKISGLEEVYLYRLEYFGNRPPYSLSYNIQSGEGIYGYNPSGTTTNALASLNFENSEELDFNNNITGYLKKIKYSTSGYEQFEYEPNRTNFNYYKKSPNYWAKPTAYNKTVQSISINNQTNQTNVTIPFAQIVRLDVGSSCSGQYGFSEASASFSPGGVMLHGYDSMLNASSYKEASFINVSNGGGTSIMYLGPGQYTLSTSAESYGATSRGRVTLYYNDILKNDFYLGGIRIKSKSKIDNNGNEMKTIYKYRDSTNTSSAYIKMSKRFANGRMSSCGNSPVPQHPFLVRDLFPNFQINSNQFIYFQKIDNNNMHYETISEEFYYNNQFKGFNKYNYYGDFSNINLINYSTNFKLFEMHNDYLAGKLKTKRTYDNNNVLKEKTEFKYTNYNFLNSNLIGFRSFARGNYLTNPWPNNTAINSLHDVGIITNVGLIPDYYSVIKHTFFIKPYIIKSNRFFLESDVTTTYFNTNNIINKNNYLYNALFNISLSNTKNSANETIETKYYYAHDLVNQALINKNMVGIPLKTETKHNGFVISTQETTYKDWDPSSSELLAPEFIKSSKASDPLETKIKFNNYDTHGNALEVQQENGMLISYIYAYNHTLPVAKLENMAYSSIPPALITAIQNATDTTNTDGVYVYNQADLKTALDNLRNDPALANAMVSTYIHKPLIGISSTTDPKGDTQTYHYDSFNRLEFVKDKNGNILSENQYHYRPN